MIDIDIIVLGRSSSQLKSPLCIQYRIKSKVKSASLIPHERSRAIWFWPLCTHVVRGGKKKVTIAGAGVCGRHGTRVFNQMDWRLARLAKLLMLWLQYPRSFLHRSSTFLFINIRPGLYVFTVCGTWPKKLARQHGDGENEWRVIFKSL